MATAQDTAEPTVAELIDQWNDGSLTLDEGAVEQADATTLQVRYSGSDGILTITFSLAEELSYRTDGEGSERFNILDE